MGTDCRFLIKVRWSQFVRLFVAVENSNYLRMYFLYVCNNFVELRIYIKIVHIIKKYVNMFHYLI